jgi:hypothetical protein
MFSEEFLGPTGSESVPTLSLVLSLLCSVSSSSSTIEADTIPEVGFKWHPVQMKRTLKLAHYPYPGEGMAHEIS